MLTAAPGLGLRLRQSATNIPIWGLLQQMATSILQGARNRVIYGRPNLPTGQLALGRKPATYPNLRGTPEVYTVNGNLYVSRRL
jgi:hypothetical protein